MDLSLVRIVKNLRLRLSQPHRRTLPRLFKTLARACVALTILAAPVMFAPTVFAADEAQTTADGRRIVRLLEICTAPNTASCDSYINGFLDGYWLSNTHSFDLFPSNNPSTRKRKQNGLSANRMADKVFKNGICLPDGVLLNELRKVLVSHLVANREAWKDTWYQTQLWQAFKTEYPCVIDTEQNTDTR